MEANWSMLILMVLVTIVAVYMGRVWFKRWFNPLSLYSFVWGCCLCGYELRLIQYERISVQAWAYIGIAWVSLYLGAAMVLLLGTSTRRDAPPELCVDLDCLKKAIIVLTVIGGIGVFDELRVIRREFGGLLEALLFHANDIYRGKLDGSLSWIPYATAFLYPACALAGVYTAKKCKPTLPALTPVTLIALTNIFSMVRAGAVMAIFLFFASFMHTPRERRFTVGRWQRLLAAGLGVVLLTSGLVIVSATRGLGVDFPGMTPAMDRITEYIPVFPSIYSNVSGTPVAFSQYLATPAEQKHGFWGEYTFRPFYRMLARFGFPTDVPYLEEDYYTPVPMNISTYLKNVHTDFGFPGILLFPYLLGAATAFLVVRGKRKPRLIGLVVLSNLYLLIAFSFVVNLMVLGDWYLSVLTGLLAAILVQFSSSTAGQPQESNAALPAHIAGPHEPIELGFHE